MEIDWWYFRLLANFANSTFVCPLRHSPNISAALIISRSVCILGCLELHQIFATFKYIHTIQQSFFLVHIFSMQKAKSATVKTTTPKWKARTAETHAKHLEFLKSHPDTNYDVCLLGASLIEHWLDDGSNVWKASPLATKYKVKLTTLPNYVFGFNAVRVPEIFSRPRSSMRELVAI